MIVKGALYVVATPIGNLDDMTPRAVEVLAQADLIAAEDTRHSRILLERFAIRTPCTALHEHNERSVVADLLARLAAGATVAVISDAGTPSIRDPGAHLVHAAHQAGFRVVPVPGASALVCALAASGFPAEHFVFEGFLPAGSAARRNRLEQLRREDRTLVFYESPHRILEALCDMAQILGSDRPAVFAREISKIYETVRCATLEQLCSWVGADANQRRGEIVVVVRGSSEPPEAAGEEERRRVLNILLAEHSVKQAVALTAKITGAPRNDLYAMAIEIAGEQ